MRLKILDDTFAVCRLSPDAQLPDWASEKGGLLSLTWTDEELSIVTKASRCPEDTPKETGWRVLKVCGPLDFALTGILSSLASPLAEAQISIFAISTFDTDYLLVKAETLQSAIRVLTAQGHLIES